ncbi:MAG: response regulator [Labilithrix sp.]|nr:response regulator [Labilithrix sp.]MCW5834708.1 response regulator [Labilithrix sp.]
MTFQPKRPSGAGYPATRPSTAPAGTPSARPANIREAAAEAHALGGGAVARPSATAARNAGKKTILLVDPDASLRARLRALLELHYDVIEAKDGMEAVEMTSSIQAPAMIVCDTVMPRVDGFTLAKILRNNPVMRRVPIMFVSAQHSPQHVTQALVIGVSQFLPKTTPVAQIVDKIRKIVL